MVRSLLALLLTAASAAAQTPLESAAPKVAAALKNAAIPLASVGVYVHEIGAARPLVAHNPDVPMNPASVMKLVTTYAALERLGPAFTWRTEAHATRALAGDVLEGDLVLKGSGDPKLNIEQFWLLVRSLRARGLREIRGDLVLDRSAFVAAESDPPRFDGEPLRPYNVHPDPLLVNFKAVRFVFMPDVDRGIVHVSAEPRLPQVELVHAVKVTSGPCGNFRAGIKADVQGGPRSARVSFTGTMPAACGERSWYLGLLSHPEYMFGIFKSLWEEQGGTIKGGWRDGGVPAGTRLLATAESAPLTEVVRDINKFSNNVMARLLYLTLSADQPGSTERSARVVGDWLREKNLALPELVIENGSGLSRIERISAGGIGRLLVDAYRSPVMPEFISSMPLVGADGTMRRRLNSESVAGHAHIKTGGLAGVRTIAGYVLDRQGRRYAVAFFINHPNAAQGQAAQDALLQAVYDMVSTRSAR